MNIYIDTNIFLAFYHLTSEDLEELNKLAVLLQKKEVVILLPNQTIDEFHRNRSHKISDALKYLKGEKLKLEFPAMFKGYPEFDELKELQKESSEKYSILYEKVLGDINSQSLKADDLIKKLFGLSTSIDTTEEIMEKARLRRDIGNPPGKTGSLGDAINWESLLKHLNKKEDLYFISGDKDYLSTLDPDKFDDFLLKEWEERKSSDLHFYKRLSSFFKDKFPDIDMAAELEKEILIEQLAASASFAHTHTIISKLSEYSGFTPQEINDIVYAGIYNDQVHWIMADGDVSQFFMRILKRNEEIIEPKYFYILKELLPDIDSSS